MQLNLECLKKKWMCLKSGFHGRNLMEYFWILWNSPKNEKSVLLPKKNNFNFKKDEITLKFRFLGRNTDFPL